MYSYFLSCARCRVPDAGDMKPPVLRHRILVSYAPLRAKSSVNVLRWILRIYFLLCKMQGARRRGYEAAGT